MNAITPSGVTQRRNIHQLSGIKDADWSGHIYCIGHSGSEKSTLLLGMASSAIQQGKGISIIDSQADLAEQLLDYISPTRIQNVYYRLAKKHRCCTKKCTKVFVIKRMLCNDDGSGVLLCWQ